MTIDSIEEVSTREKLLIATADLIQMHGYRGSGLTAILKKAGIPKGSLYHHFPDGKDELVSEAIRHSGKMYLRQYAESMKTFDKVEDGLNDIIDYLKNRLLESDYARGCPISTVALEVSNTNDSIRNVCWEVYTRWEASFATYLEMKNIDNAEEKAKLLLEMIEGAFILSKAHKSVQHLELIKKAIPKILN